MTQISAKLPKKVVSNPHNKKHSKNIYKRDLLDEDISCITPADQVVVFHVAILAQVNGYHLAPEQQPLHQHPAKRCHEEQMEQSCYHCAGHLKGTGSQGKWGQNVKQPHCGHIPA